MRVIDLYPQEIDTAPIIDGEQWGLDLPAAPCMRPAGKKLVLKQVGVTGDGCTMCFRHKKRTGDGVVKPKFFKGTDPSAPRVLCVFSYNSYGITVDRVVEYIRTFHKGHILVDLPVRCGEGNVTDVQLDACRPYLRKTHAMFRPERIICFGGRASSAVLGVAVPAWSNRWCWTTLPGFQPTPVEGEEPAPAPRIPVVVTMDPTSIAKSKVHAEIIHREIKWAIEGVFPDARPKGKVYVIDSEADLPGVDKWVALAKERGGWVAHDVETNGVMYNPDFSIIAAGFASPNLPHVLVWDAAALANPVLLKKCIEILEDPDLGKKGSNLKYDRQAWRFWKGVVVAPFVGDSRLEMRQANADSSATLEAMAFYVGINAHKAEAKAHMATAMKDARNEVDPDMEGVSAYAFVYKYLPLDVMLRYNGLDCYTTAKVCEYSRMALGPLEPTLHRLILPASEMYEDVESEGMLLSVENIAIARHYLETEVAKMMPLFEINGIDPDKPDSIRQWLERMDIESPIRTATDLASTNAKALGLIKHKNEVIARILEYRKIAKLLSSYATTLPGYIRGDGRVHPSFLLDGARSGRASCIAGDQRLWTNHGLVRFDELGELLAVAPVYTFTHAGAWRRVTACWSTGVKPTVKTETASGKSVRTTADHALRSDKGWTEAGYLGGGRVAVSGSAEVGPFTGEDQGLSSLEGYLASRRNRTVGDNQDLHPATSLAVDVLQSSDEMAGCLSEPWGKPEAVLLQHEALVRDLRNAYRDAPSERYFSEKHREREGCGEEGSNTGREGQRDGQLGAECVAAAQAIRVQRVSGGHQLEGVGVLTGHGGCLHEDEEPHLRGLPSAGTAGTWDNVESYARKGEPSGVHGLSVHGVAEHELPGLQVQKTHEGDEGAVPGLCTGPCGSDDVGSGEQCGARADSERDSACKAGEAGLRGEIPGSGFCGDGRGSSGSGRRVPQYGIQESCGYCAKCTVRKARAEGFACEGHACAEQTGPGCRQGFKPRYETVVSIEAAGVSEVFDFSVEGDHSGLVEGVFAHNCRSPALQTIPSRGPLAKLIKNCFVARPGYVLVASDFSILEIKVAAILSKDPEMAKAAQLDFHTETAKNLSHLAWQMTPEAVEAEIKSGVKTKRDAMKVLGFSVLYGAGPDSIAEKIGCSVKEAIKLIESFFKKYSRLKAWLNEQLAFAREYAMVEVPWLDGTIGRIRPLLDIVSSDYDKRGNSERASGNTPIQSLASDICLSSAVRIRQHYIDEKIPAKIICLVHDSIISEVREDYVDHVVAAKKRYMTNWETGSVPLTVEVEVGPSWGTMKKVA